MNDVPLSSNHNAEENHMRRHKSKYPPRWKGIATKIKEKAGWKCQKCGYKPSGTAGDTLGVHHINGDTRDNKDSNLIALCQPCHLKEERKLQARWDREDIEKAGQLNMLTIKQTPRLKR